MWIISSSAIAESQDECAAKLRKLHELDALHALDWKPPKPPHVVAGPTYYNFPFDRREQFAQLVSCALVAPGQCVNFDIKHWQTGKPSERFHMCRLKPA